MTAAGDGAAWSDEAAAALERNARFLEVVVEGMNVCPFARKARIDGATLREVLPDPVADGAFADEAVLGAVLDRLTESDTLEVAQLIFPRCALEPRAWGRAVKDLTARLQSERGRSTVGVAAFHPALPYTDQNAATLVPLFRRAPDPTIQWIRLDVLERVRRGRGRADVAVPTTPEAVRAFLAQPPRKPLDEEIADANRTRVHAMGLDVFEALLADLVRSE